jgi:hypothetical protein
MEHLPLMERHTSPIWQPEIIKSTMEGAFKKRQPRIKGCLFFNGITEESLKLPCHRLAHHAATFTR